MISFDEIERYGYTVLSSFDERGIHLIRNEDFGTKSQANRFTYPLGPRQKGASTAKELTTKLFKAAMLKAEEDIKSGLVEKAYLAWRMK